MTNIRIQAESLLSKTLEDPEVTGLPINIIGPDGSKNGGNAVPYYGQVNYVSRNEDGFMVGIPSVVLRLSSLAYIPKYGDKCTVEIPETPNPEASMITYTLNRPPKRNNSLGIITIYLTKLEQS